MFIVNLIQWNNNNRVQRTTAAMRIEEKHKAHSIVHIQEGNVISNVKYICLSLTALPLCVASSLIKSSLYCLEYTDVFNSSHNFEITIEGTHACKGANELSKQLLSIPDVPEQVYRPLFFSFIHTHTHTYALIQHTYTKLDIEVNSKKKEWSAIFLSPY